MKYKGDIPLVAYINFETTVPTNECLDPENRKTFAVLYVIISAFHPKLDIDRVIIERSFDHSCDNKTLLQLRDCALAITAKNSSIAISQMFTTELEFAADCLLKCFNKKFKFNNLKLNNDAKRKYEIEHPIDWS